MKSRTVASIVTLALCTTGVVVAEASPASASSRHCATESNYKKVKKGQTLAKVARELHSHGHKESGAHSGGYRDEIRSYKTCDTYGSIAISFSANPGEAFRVDAKSGVFSG